MTDRKSSSLHFVRSKAQAAAISTSLLVVMEQSIARLSNGASTLDICTTNTPSKSTTKLSSRLAPPSHHRTELDNCPVSLDLSLAGQLSIIRTFTPPFFTTTARRSQFKHFIYNKLRQDFHYYEKFQEP